MPRLSLRAIDRALADADPATLALLDTYLPRPVEPFNAWLKRATPSYHWDWPHLRSIQDALAKVTTGEITRLYIHEPPRHGKTEQNTIRYPVYRIAHTPEYRAIIGAYNATIAAQFGRKARRVARQMGIPLNEERTAADDWETLAGGGVRSVGMGGGITGHGADGIFIDDPIKSREEAESLVYRDKAWDWYRDDLYTRLEPGGSITLTATRWHDDDLAGRILASEDGPNWTVIHLPAFADAPDDPLHRILGAALCPDRFDEEALARIRSVLGEYGFAALYQGRPRPREGNQFPRDRIQVVDTLPAQMPTVRYWDKAGTRDGGARTAGVKIAGPHQGLWYVCDSRIFQKEAAERDADIRATTALDGHSVRVRAEQEPGSAGKDGGANFIRMLAGYDVASHPVTGDKVTRAEGFAAQWQAGNVRLLRGAWNKAYLDEAETFPTGKFKDQVDASAGAFQDLAARANVGAVTVGAKGRPTPWRMPT